MEAVAETESKYPVVDIPLKEIWNDNDFNCRGDELVTVDVLELAENIKDQGLLQPVVVAPIPADKPIPGYKYRLIVGFRRTLAHKHLRRETITAIVRDDIKTELQALSINLSENLHRRNLNILQEAKALLKMQKYGMDRQDYAALTGKSDGWVQVRLMLLELPGEVQAEVALGKVNISQQQIRRMYSIKATSGPAGVIKAFCKIRDSQMRGNTRPPTLKTKNDSLKSKSLRAKGEQADMQDYLRESNNNVNNILTSVIAWTMGEISTGEFLDRYKTYCEDNDILYYDPQFLSDLG